MSEHERTLWAGNLPDKITEELLYELFLQVGPLEKIVIPQSRDGKKSMYGFVVFKHTESVPYAIKAMELVTVFGRHLVLKQRNVGHDARDPDKDSPNRNSPQYRGSPSHKDGPHRGSPTYPIVHNVQRPRDGSYNHPQLSQGWFNQQTFMPSHQIDSVSMQAIRNRIQHSTRLLVNSQHGRRGDYRQHRDKFYERPQRR